MVTDRSTSAPVRLEPHDLTKETPARRGSAPTDSSIPDAPAAAAVDHCDGPECFAPEDVAPDVSVCACSCTGCARAVALLVQAQGGA